MVGKWLVVLPLLVDFNKVTLQPITTDCCRCSASTTAGLEARSYDRLSDDFTSVDCPCRPRGDDAEASASILMPALRAMQPFVEPTDQKSEPKPLLQPEVGLASSVLETLRQATDEEYQEALARDAARSAVRLFDSALEPLDDTLIEAPKNKVNIFFNTNGDAMDDNLPEPSHIQETRCIHSPLKGIHKNRELKISRPAPIIEVIELSPKPTRKLKNKGILHRNLQDMDNGIGASNIQERVIHSNLNHELDNVNLKSNPELLSLFKHNKLGKTDDQNGLQKTISIESNLSEKAKAKIHLKLRELIDTLEDISKKEKSKVPVIDFKNYISTSTLTPPFKLKPIQTEKNNKRPLFLKDLLKLRDVELIPRNSLTKNVAAEKSLHPNLKLQSEGSRVQNYNPDIDNIDNSNPIPIMNKDIKMTITSIHPDIIDTETSPTNSKPLFISKSNESNKIIEQNSMPIECLANPENSDISSVPVDLESQDDFDYGEIKYEDDSNKEPFLSDNCEGLNVNSFMQELPYNKYEKQGFNNIGLRKGQIPKLESSEDTVHEESNNEIIQIEQLEDLDTPIEFDNSSFIPKEYLNNNENTLYTIANNKHTLNKPVSDTSYNDLQEGKRSNERPIMSQINLKNKFGDCNQESLPKKIFSEYLSSMEKNQEINLMKQIPSEDHDNQSDHDTFSDINEDPTQVSYKDLQNMSNTILNLSECEPPREGNVNTNIHFNERLNQINDFDKANSASPTSLFVVNSKKKESEDILDAKSSFNTNSEMNELPGMNSNENLCTSKTFDEIPYNIDGADIKKTINSGVKNSEMRAEASEPESKLYNPMTPLFQNTVENDKESKNLSTVSAGINDIAKVDKYSNFRNSLKSKLEGLFSTTEKVSDFLNSPDDNINESSHMSAMVTKFDKFQTLDNLQRTPQTLLRETLLPKFLGTPLNAYKNKLAVPSYANQPLRSNSLNLLNFPLDLSKPYADILQPSLTFSALSDKLRSHTENTINNVKETLESTLKASDSFHLSRPTDTIHTQDILQSISDRRDEMKEKLEAIHLDLNDRFSSFQHSVRDHFNVPRGRNLEFREDSNEGFETSNIPIKMKLLYPDVSKFENIKYENNFFPHRVNGPKNGKNTEMGLMSSKIPIVPDADRFRNSDRKPSLQNQIFYSTTTAIPSFIPRPKVLKSNIDTTPRLTSDTFLKTRPTKIPISSENKLTRNKPLLMKPDQTSNLSEEHYNLPSSSSRTKMPTKSFRTNMEKINKEDLQTDYPVNKFRKTLLQEKLHQNSRNDYLTLRQNLGTRNFNNNGRSSANQETLSNLMNGKKGKTRTGEINDDELTISPTSHMDTVQPTKNEMGLRLVEPMKENVPYKCKLICYKD